MTQESRRNVLKGLGLALPAAWSRPIVETVVLPAHAQTSTDNQTSTNNTSVPAGCDIPAGCYNFVGNNTGAPDFSLSWPGGAVATNVPVGNGRNCVATPGVYQLIIVATSLEEAIALRDAEGNTTFVNSLMFQQIDPVESGCNFFSFSEEEE